MGKGRLEAFSDGVLAIIITIMVLELRVPRGTALADLKPMLPIFLSYLLSFIYVGIYWNNHHHLFQVTHRVSGAVLWANLHLLFWLSIVPFVTAWMGENNFAQTPVICYGVVLLLAGIAFWILQRAIVHAPGGSNALLAAAVGRDFKGNISLVIYIAAITLGFFKCGIALSLYALVALIWLVPDRRIERVVGATEPLSPD